MSINVESLLIKLAVDAKDLDKLPAGASKFDKLSSVMRKAAKAAAVVGGALVAGGVVAANAASRQEQAFGALDSVFGRNSATVQKWAAGAAKAAGLSKAQYGEMASVMGAQLTNLGLDLDTATAGTGKMIQLGADLAAQFGGSSAEAVNALSAAFRGEADPAERYGLRLNQTAIMAELAARGQDKLKGAALTAAKAQAVMDLATKQAGGAVGAYGREAGTMAGRMQTAKAEVANTAATLGTALLPMVAAVAGKLGEMAGWAERNATLVQVLASVIGALAAAILVANAALKVYKTTTELIAAVQKATWLTNPITLVILAIVALAAALVIAYKKSETFRSIVQATFRAVRSAISTVAGVFRSTWEAAVSSVRGYINAWRAVMTGVLGIVRGLIRAVTALFRGDWSGAVLAVRGIVSSFGEVFRGVFRALPGPVQAVVRAVGGLLVGAFNTAKGAASGIRGALTASFDAARASIGWLIDKISQLIGWIGKIKFPKPPAWVGKLNPFSGPGPGFDLPPGPAPRGPRGPRGPGVPRVPRVPFPAGFGGPALAYAGAGGGLPGSTTYNITIPGLVVDPEGTARAIRRILADHERRM